MRGKSIFALFAFICGLLWPYVALCADYIVSDVYGDELHLEQDVHLAPGVVVNAGKIYVDASLRMFNRASILSDIYVCDNCDFLIRNSGDISGRVHLGDGAVMTQVIHTAADVSFLDADRPFVVVADSVHDVEWTDLLPLGMNAGTLVLRDSGVVFSDLSNSVPYASASCGRIVLDGVVYLHLADGYILNDGLPLMRNVYGDASVVVGGITPGKLYAYVAKIENNDLYIEAVRETDYYKILGDERGIFLNLVREISPSDALLRRLDGAETLAEIRHIMSQSVVFNPGMLAQPIRIIDKFMTDGVNVDDISDSGVVSIGGGPFHIVSSDYDIYGALFNLNTLPYAGFSGGVSVYGGMTESDDEVNEFKARLFGGNMHALYSGSWLKVHGLVGATYGSFDVPYVFDSGYMRHDVRGTSAYGVVDAGLVLGIFTPYVGAEYHMARVLHLLSVETALRAGLDSLVSWQGEAGIYKCKTGAGLNSYKDAWVGVAIGFYSPDDMLGGDVALNIIHADHCYAGMFSFSVKIEF